MANTTITNLRSAVALNGTEQIPAVQSGATVRLTVSDIASYTATIIAPPTLSIGSGVSGGTPGYGLYVDASTTLGQFAYGSGVFNAIKTATGTTGAPVLYNGFGGTPSSLTLTNATGLPIGGISATGSPGATNFLRGDGSWAQPILTVSSTAISGATNGFLLYNNAGLLGAVAPTAASLSIGSPITGGTNGFGLYVDASTQLGQFAYGTGVRAALSVNVGSAGAPVLFNGAGGTPASLTLTSATGLPIGGISATGTPSITTFLRGDGVWASVSGGSGTVTSVSVTTANGISGTVANATTTPAISLTLGAITPTSVNGLTLTAAATGFSVAGGTTSKTLTVSNTLTLAGTDGSTLTIGAGGTLGSLAFLSAAPAGTLTGTTLNATVVSSSLTSVGTIATGAWQGTGIGIAYGGTGQSTTALGTLVVGASGSTTTNLGIGTTGQVLTVSGGTATWQNAAAAGVSTISFGSTGLTPATATSGAVSVAGTLAAGSGGTGLATLTANSVLLGNGTSAVQLVAPSTTGNVLTSNGTTWTSAAPAGVPSGTIEIGPGATYLTTAASSSAGTATVTFGGVYTIPVGATVTISGVTPSGFNGSYTVTASSAGSVSFANATAGPQTVAGSLYMTPAGYLRCDGSVYLRSSYPTLATLIGTPIKLAIPTLTYTNNSLNLANGTVTSPYQTNSVLIMTGTANASSGAATATANAMLTSTDGTTWTARTSWNVAAANYYNDAVAFGASIYVAIADSSQYTSTIPSAISSPDLVTWTKRPFTGPIAQSGVCDLCFGGTSNVFVYPINNGSFCNNIASSLAYLFYSANGTSYTAATITPGSGIYIGCAAYASGVVVCTDQKVFYSAGGITYTDITSNVLGSATVAGIASISYANGQFILGVGTAANSSITGLYTSTTGASGSWTKVSVNSAFTPYLGSNGAGSLPNIGKIRWNGTIYLQNIGATAYYSTDLINWNNSGTNVNGYTAVLSSKFWGTVYNAGSYSNNGTTYTAATRYVQSIDSNAYIAATQFPVPSSFSNGSGTAPGGFGGTVAIIKT